MEDACGDGRRVQTGDEGGLRVAEHRLVSAALNYADENDFVRVVLSPTERSIPLYQRDGFGPADALMLRTPPQAPTGSASRST